MINKIEVKWCVLQLQPSPTLLLMSGWYHCNKIGFVWLGRCFVSPAAQLPADRKHQPAMADPQRTAAAAGSTWSTGTARRSRHVHVRDRLQPETVHSPGRRWPPWGWRRVTALPSQCKLRTLQERGGGVVAGGWWEEEVPGLRLVLVFHSDIYKDGQRCYCSFNWI